eukprot:1697588-Prymnesium_polylepis.1
MWPTTPCPRPHVAVPIARHRTQAGDEDNVNDEEADRLAMPVSVSQSSHYSPCTISARCMRMRTRTSPFPAPRTYTCLHL